MEKIKQLLGPMRVPFLILTPACVLLGVGTAMWVHNQVNIFQAILVLIGAVSAHISVNAFNEYFDFQSGLDLKTERTPFSGGSGTLPEKPGLAPSALNIAITTFVLTALVGMYFMYVQGLALLPLGILGLIIIYVYTKWITQYPLLCLLAPGLGFGPLMVMGTHFSLTGAYSWTPLIASLIPFFLVSNLLLLNQFPDIEPDKKVGRKHLPIAAGRKNSVYIFGLFFVLTYLVIIVGVYFAYLPTASLIGLLTIVIAIPTTMGAFRYAEDIKKLVPYMGLNVVINIITPILVATGLFIGW
ncbi:MAG: prenyltransferase [Anaerolineaceae bacterium 4572_78]|nr:MAG: prenyltransferase [Anaerolineaceae bacterium 4572_78]